MEHVKELVRVSLSDSLNVDKPETVLQKAVPKLTKRLQDLPLLEEPISADDIIVPGNDNGGLKDPIALIVNLVCLKPEDFDEFCFEFLQSTNAATMVETLAVHCDSDLRWCTWLSAVVLLYRRYLAEYFAPSELLHARVVEITTAALTGACALTFYGHQLVKKRDDASPVAAIRVASKQMRATQLREQVSALLAPFSWIRSCQRDAISSLAQCGSLTAYLQLAFLLGDHGIVEHLTLKHGFVADRGAYLAIPNNGVLSALFESNFGVFFGLEVKLLEKKVRVCVDVVRLRLGLVTLLQATMQSETQRSVTVEYVKQAFSLCCSLIDRVQQAHVGKDARKAVRSAYSYSVLAAMLFLDGGAQAKADSAAALALDSLLKLAFSRGNQTQNSVLSALLMIGRSDVVFFPKNVRKQAMRQVGQALAATAQKTMLKRATPFVELDSLVAQLNALEQATPPCKEPSSMALSLNSFKNDFITCSSNTVAKLYHKKFESMEASKVLVTMLADVLYSPPSQRAMRSPTRKQLASEASARNYANSPFGLAARVTSSSAAADQTGASASKTGAQQSTSTEIASATTRPQ
ncbi:MAG: hypothetical protein MHM6MM_004537 [Cercozoa sp. M6MM]